MRRCRGEPPTTQSLSQASSACPSLPLCRFVTTFKSESNKKAVGTLYLIRSYDHTQRTSPDQSLMSTRQQTMRSNRTNTGRSGNTVRSGNIGRGGQAESRPTTTLNYEDAQDFEIWEVARAATAAHWYFEPLKIDIPPLDERRQLIFTDGGFDRTNNPTLECTREVEDFYGRDSIGIVVSIGTARKDDRPPRRRILPIIPWTRELAQQNTDPEKVHADVLKKSTRAHFPYFRLNHPGGLDIELDEWEPKGRSTDAAGSSTIQRMTTSFNTWALDLDNDSLLRDCATELVERRRKRIEDEDRWERFATGAQYRCRLKRCEGGYYFFKQKFRDHLRTEHFMEEDEIDQEQTACRQCWRYRRSKSTKI